MLEDRSKINQNLLFFGLVTAILMLTFGFLSMSGRTYIYLDIGADTYSSNWPYYGWFGDQLRSGQLTFWSFSLGLGGNMISFSPLLADPFNIILFLFPSHAFPTGILITTIVKYYVLAALSRAYLGKLGFRGNALIVASLCYTFSGYFISWGQHYHFASMFVFFTWMLYAFERYLDIKKRGMLILSIALLGLFSVYFLFMIFVFFVVYAIVRYFVLHQFTLKSFFRYITELLVIGLVGAGMSAVLLIPQAAVLLNSPRVSGGLLPTLGFDSLQWYTIVLIRILSNLLLGVREYYGMINFYEDPFLSTGVIAVFLFPVLMSRKVRNRTTVLALSLIILALLFPGFFNPIFNAFSANTTRWTFVFVPLFCIGIARALTVLFESNNIAEFRYNFIFGFLFGVSAFVIAFLTQNRAFLYPNSLNLLNRSAIIVVGLLLLTYFVFFLLGRKPNKKSFLCLLLLLLTLDLGFHSFAVVNMRSTLAADGSNFHVPYFDDSLIALETIDNHDSSFFRVAKNYSFIDLADPLIQAYYGEKQYNSAMPSSFWTFQYQFRLPRLHSNWFFGFGQNELLRSFLTGRYLIANNHETRFGYIDIAQAGSKRVFMNTLSLPLGVVQNNIIDAQTFNEMGIIDRTYALYYGFITDDNDLLSQFNSSILDVNSLPMRTSDIIPAKYFVEDNALTILPCSTTSGLTYLSLSVNLPALAVMNIIVTSQPYNSEQIESPLLVEMFPAVTHYEIPLSIQNITQLRFEFPFIFTYDNLINVEYRLLNVDNIKTRIETLQNTSMNLIEHSANFFEGNIQVVEDSLLFFSIPYDIGWTATVNGEQVPIHVVNTTFMGIVLESGYHNITLRYRVPGMMFGAIVSTISFALFITLLFAYRQRSFSEVMIAVRKKIQKLIMTGRCYSLEI